MKKLGNKIIKILSVDPYNFVLKIKFDDQSIKKISIAHLFEHPKGLVSEIMRGGFFHQCFIENGALAWPNGFELCPDALRLWAIPKKKPKQYPLSHR